MIIVRIDKLICKQTFPAGKAELIYPFVMFRLENPVRIVPAWLELLASEPTESEMISRALIADVVIPKNQNLDTWHALESASILNWVTRKATAYTAHHWLKRADSTPSTGDFQLLVGESPVGWFFGTFADSSEAARKFISDHESATT